VSIVLTGAQKRALKSRAQTLDAIIRVGQGGLSEPMVAGMDRALETHELVKVRFVGQKEEKRTLAPELAEKTSSVLVQMVGNVAVYYRPSRPPGRPEDEANA
jgi:RNA-binding protein